MASAPITVTARDGAYDVLVARGARTRLRTVLADADITGDMIVVSSRRVWTAQGARFKRITPIL
ncbi:MAG: hypothetical protein ABI880_09475, partial [Acidobacteriota bacterium]